MRRYLGFTIGLAAALLVAAPGCGLGGPGDKDEVDAAQHVDSAVDSASNDDGGIDAQEVDAAPPAVHTIDATTLRHDEIPYAMGQTYVDLRPAGEYMESYIPKAKSIPEETLWDGQDLVNNGQALLLEATVKTAPLFFYHHASSQTVTMAIAEAALEMGYTDVYVLEGGIEAWWDAGFYQDISLGGLESFYYDPIPANVYIVDTMDATAYENDGHITGASNLETIEFFDDGQLVNGGQALMDLVPCAPTAVIFYCVNEGCSASEEACEAAEQMGCYDNTLILHFAGGLELWENTGHPVSCGPDPNGPSCQ